MVKPTQAICEKSHVRLSHNEFQKKKKKVGRVKLAERKETTHRDVPRHVVLACEGSGIYALRRVNDAYERPDGGEECGWEDVVPEGAREPPEVGRRVFRDGRGVD